MSDPTSFFSPAAVLSEPPFVGRLLELTALESAFQRAFGGQGGVVLLGGDAGIGKTRLAAEVLSRARKAGAYTCWGNSYSWEGAPPYRPWVEILRGYLDELSDSELRDQIGANAAEIARIVPLIAQRLPDLSELPDASPVEGRFRLFDAIAAFIRNAARRQPLVFVLDDLHWADRDSLRLLQFIAREIGNAPILILGTYRHIEAPPGSLLSEVLADLARVPGVQPITLGGLADDDIGQLVENTTGEAVSEPVLARIREETGGNPLFIAEISRLLASEDRFKEPLPDDRLPLPNSVLEVIGSRLDRLSPACRDLLGIASVIGNRFQLELLQHVAGGEPVGLLKLLDEAIAARLIRQTSVPTSLQFEHPLVENVVHQRLSLTKKMDLHGRLGEGLEAVDPQDHEGLARHFIQAAPLGYRGKAIEYAIRSGDRAMDQAAWSSAAGHYQQAVLLEQLKDTDLNRLCELLLALGDALNKAAPAGTIPPEARDAFRRAAGIARESGSTEQLARAAHGFTGQWLAIFAHGTEQLDLIKDALEALGEDESELRVYLLGHYALNLRHTYSVPPGHVIELVDEAVELAHRIGSADAETFALLVRIFARSHPKYIEERQIDFRRISRIMSESIDPYLAGYIRAGYCTMALERGDLSIMKKKLGQFSDYCSRYGFETWVVYREELNILIALLEGRFQDAEALLMSEENIQTTHDIPFLDQFLMLYRQQDRSDEIIPLIDKAIARLRVDHTEPGFEDVLNLFRIFHLILCLDCGLEETAHQLFVDLTRNGLRRLSLGSDWLLGMTLLAEACESLDDRVHADVLYEMLLPYADRVAASAFSLTCTGTVRHHLGLLASILERREEAEEHFERAMEMSEHMGARPFSAWTEFNHAVMLLRRDGTGDRDKAAGLLERALSTADELGMKRLQIRARPLMDELEPVAPTETGSSHGLTPRQLEVLGLAAEGLSDREIGEKLFISHHTVMRHLANIFNTLGVSSRTAAVAYAIRQGLLDTPA